MNLFLRWYAKLNLIGISCILYITFIIALLNGGAVRVTINQFGEMWLESILLTVSLILSCYIVLREEFIWE